MKHSRRRLVQSAGTVWISNFRYGFEGAPVFGSFSSNTLHHDILQRQMYCKALVYASCGGRLARDWIAGCASLSLHDGELVTLALQHDATREDLVRLHGMLAQRRKLHGGDGRTTDHPTPSAASVSTSTSPSTSAASAPTFFPQGYRAPSFSALSPGTSQPDDDVPDIQGLQPLSPEQAETVARCFVYDAVKAASFHVNGLLPEQIEHLEHVCVTLGLSSATSDMLPPERFSECGDNDDNGNSSSSNGSALDDDDAAPASNGNVASSSAATRGRCYNVTKAPTQRSSNPFLQAALDIVGEENAVMRAKFRVIEQHGSGH